jgi:ABC-type dipeptide/oligopeptide/nickel transport system ATPase component
MYSLKVQGLRVEAANKVPILKDIAIDIRGNKITCLLGESGAGKTILSKTISALLPEAVLLKKGEFFFNNEPIGYEHLKKLRGKEIFYAPQNASASLNPVVKIRKQIMEVSRIKLEHVIQVLKELEFSDPEVVLDSYPFELSGGENQRCLLAMAIASKPHLLILDEPTAALDYDLQERLIVLIKRIYQQYNLTLLIITHNLSFAEVISDHIYIIFKGEIVDHGPPGSLLTSPTHPYTREIVDHLILEHGASWPRIPRYSISD